MGEDVNQNDSGFRWFCSFQSVHSEHRLWRSLLQWQLLIYVIISQFIWKSELPILILQISNLHLMEQYVDTTCSNKLTVAALILICVVNSSQHEYVQQMISQWKMMLCIGLMQQATPVRRGNVQNRCKKMLKRDQS